MVEYTTNPTASQLGDALLVRPPVGGSVGIEQALHRHEELIHAVIRREGGGSLTYEEALQAGRIGLWGELAEDLDEAVEQALIREALFTVLSQLPHRLRQVTVARYGLDGHPPRTLRQLGAQLGLPHERIRQPQQDALAWLRHPAHSLPLRQLLDKNTAADYRQALALNAALRRARRRTR